MKKLELVLGRYDDPENQIQENYPYDLYHSNLAIFGSSMSGKTYMLKTILVRIHQVIRAWDKEEIYILDFSNSLISYGELPYVVACFDASNDENIRRIFKIIEEKMEEHVHILAGQSYDQCQEEIQPSHVTFILDGLNSFFTEGRYESYQEKLLRLSRDGLSKGITVIFAANEPTNGISRLLPSFNRIIAFDMSRERYADLFSSRVDKPIIGKGRGLANLDTDVYEFQAFLPYNYEKFKDLNDPDGEKISGEKISMSQMVREMEKYVPNISMNELSERKLITFISDVNVDTWDHYIKKAEENPIYEPGKLIAGIDYYSFERFRLDLMRAQSIAIYGRRKSGKSNLLRLILYGAMGIPGVRFVFWDDGRKALLGKDNQDIVDYSANVRDIIDYLPDIDAATHGQPCKKVCEEQIEFENFFRKYGYYDLPEDMITGAGKTVGFKPSSHPFTVFVIQSRLYYSSLVGGKGSQLIFRLARYITNAVAENVLFIFSDVQKIADVEMRVYFNNSVQHAFLLDDIIHFVKDKGSTSVYGSQDPAELKEKYGRFEVGDAYYWGLDYEDTQKLKMVDVSNECISSGDDSAGHKLGMWEIFNVGDQLEAGHEYVNLFLRTRKNIDDTEQKPTMSETVAEETLDTKQEPESLALEDPLGTDIDDNQAEEETPASPESSVTKGPLWDNIDDEPEEKLKKELKSEPDSDEEEVSSAPDQNDTDKMQKTIAGILAQIGNFTNTDQRMFQVVGEMDTQFEMKLTEESAEKEEFVEEQPESIDKEDHTSSEGKVKNEENLPEVTEAKEKKGEVSKSLILPKINLFPEEETKEEILPEPVEIEEEKADRIDTEINQIIENENISKKEKPEDIEEQNHSEEQPVDKEQKNGFNSKYDDIMSLLGF